MAAGSDPARREDGWPEWSHDDLRLDQSARQLLLRLTRDDDGSALEELVNLTGPRLNGLVPRALDEAGLCVAVPLVDMWFGELLVLSEQDVPGPFLAASFEWLTGRARALVNGLSAQPMSWEPGYSREAAVSWIERLEIAPADQEWMYVTLVALHRLPLATRRVMRDVAIEGLEPEASAAKWSLGVDEVRRLSRSGRAAIFEASERHEQERGGGDA